jgi:hypothetical protein
VVWLAARSSGHHNAMPLNAAAGITVGAGWLIVCRDLSAGSVTAWDQKMRLLLYQRDDCKLCDEAVALLAIVRAPEFESVWSDGDADLEARYGIRVPVLRDDVTGRELGWPFDAGALRRFLNV